MARLMTRMTVTVQLTGPGHGVVPVDAPAAASQLGDLSTATGAPQGPGPGRLESCPRPFAILSSATRRADQAPS